MVEADVRVSEVAPGIHRMALPLGMYGITSVNSYLLEGPSGATIVDCGIAVAEQPGSDGTGTEATGTGALEAALRACGTKLSDVRRLVVTHAHVDHYGLAGEVVRATGADLWMHVRADAEVAKYRDPDTAVDTRRRMLADHGLFGEQLDQGAETLLEWLPVMPSVGVATTRLRGGERFSAAGEEWEVVHTPGHSPGHVCLWAPGSRTLLSGDHLLPKVVPPVTYERGLALDPLGNYLTSLERVEQLAPAWVLPGHGSPFADGAARARSLARSKSRRLAQVLRILQEEPLPVTDVTARLYGEQLNSWPQSFAMTEVLACLAHHDVRGTAYRVPDKDGVMVWHALPEAAPGG